MILRSLDLAYDRLRADPAYTIAPNGYSLQKITFKIVITATGQLFEIQDARVPVEGRLQPTRVLVPGATKPSGSGVYPRFLWDNSGYMLGYKAKDDEEAEVEEREKKKARTRHCFSAFRDKHLQLRTEVASPAFSAVCRFLEGWDPDRARDFPVLADAATTGFGVFQIQAETEYVHQDSAVVRWWDTRLGHSSAKPQGQCLVTGKRTTLAKTHPKIKGVVGAQGAGATIAGYNKSAYESYGKKQSYNAPVSEDAAFRYVTALNALLDGPQRFKHCTTLGDTTIAFWTERPTTTEDIFLPFIAKGSAVIEEPSVQDEGLRQKLLGFLEALREGREAYPEIEGAPDQTSFFMLGLAPNTARIAIRFFHRGTLAELLANVRQHHRDIGLVPQPAVGKRPADLEFPPAWLLLRQTAHDTKGIPPILSGPLLRAIITGSRYPEGLYAAVLRRIKLGAPVHYVRACAIKGYLNRNLRKEVSMVLDPARGDPAYRLGRLFAALEKTQKDALGERLNKTIRDSYYGAASSTPGTIFPRLLRTYQHHLAKLEGGYRVNRERLIQDILAPLGDFPAHLSLADQGLFAIGYYHQTREFYAKRGNPIELSQSAEERRQK